MVDSLYRDKILICGICSAKGELRREGVFCPSCKRIVLKLPKNLVNYLEHEEIANANYDLLQDCLGKELVRIRTKKAKMD
jgi:hypothetical protein